jgi:sugar lactone lactonase YvrE
MKEKMELVLDAKAVLGEGPCWDQERHILYWLDILQKKVHIYQPETHENREIQLDQLIGTIALRKKGGAIAALEKGFYFIDEETGQFELICDPERNIPNNRFNDGKCDAAGRFWAGTMDKTETSNQGALYCLDSKLRVETKLQNLGISNGLAWSSDNQHFYFIDTPTKKVLRFDFHIATGDIVNPVEVISFEDQEGMPDGMTIDEEGMLWIAHWGGAKVSRWDPASGKQLTEVLVPAKNVTSCTFGGEDLKDLYITTARKGMGEDELEKYPHSGGLFRIRTEVKGVPAYVFNG